MKDPGGSSRKPLILKDRHKKNFFMLDKRYYLSNKHIGKYQQSQIRLDLRVRNVTRRLSIHSDQASSLSSIPIFESR
jgi:hypothetical protein